MKKAHWKGAVRPSKLFSLAAQPVTVSITLITKCLGVSPKIN